MECYGTPRNAFVKIWNTAEYHHENLEHFRENQEWKSGTMKIRNTTDPEPLTEEDEGGGGGSTEVNILYPKKSQLQNLSIQKKSLYF